jgi:hypothetical protein
MLPKTLNTYDQIVDILAGFPKLEEDDYIDLDLTDQETVRDLIKYLYMTLEGLHTAMSQLKIASMLEMRDYIIVQMKETEKN